MAKWLVALFGHWKPRFELREKKLTAIEPIVAYGYRNEPYYYDVNSFTEEGKGLSSKGYMKLTPDKQLAGTVDVNRTASRHVEMPTGFDEQKYFIYNVQGWEKRVEPGDIISAMPWKADYIPSQQMGKSFLMITIGGLAESQTDALCERYWDMDSYKPYDPATFDDWYTAAYLKAEQAVNNEKRLALLEKNKIVWYDEYVKNEQSECTYPRESLKKRRFHIPLNDLEALGVDNELMLCRECFYNPGLRDVEKLECYDKLKARYVTEEDGLNLIRPLVYGGDV